MTEFPITHKIGVHEEMALRIETLEAEIGYVYTLLKSICDFVGMGYVEEVVNDSK